jgi:hypothetical protein
VAQTLQDEWARPVLRVKLRLAVLHGGRPAVGGLTTAQALAPPAERHANAPKNPSCGASGFLGFLGQGLQWVPIPSNDGRLFAPFSYPRIIRGSCPHPPPSGLVSPRAPPAPTNWCGASTGVMLLHHLHLQQRCSSTTVIPLAPLPGERSTACYPCRNDGVALAVALLSSQSGQIKRSAAQSLPLWVGMLQDVVCTRHAQFSEMNSNLLLPNFWKSVNPPIRSRLHLQSSARI